MAFTNSKLPWKTWTVQSSVHEIYPIDTHSIITEITCTRLLVYTYYKELKIGKVRECYYFPNEVPKTKELDDYKCACRNAIN